MTMKLDELRNKIRYTATSKLECRTLAQAHGSRSSGSRRVGRHIYIVVGDLSLVVWLLILLAL